MVRAIQKTIVIPQLHFIDKVSPCAGRAGTSARWSMSHVVQVVQVPQVQFVERTIELTDRWKNH